MIEITIKTLDSQNHSFSVPDDTTVKQFKEKIFEKLPFPVDSQRLIYCGRVLQDDKNLSEYDVNGKVIHLVQRPPPQASQPSNRAPGSGPRTAGGGQRERRFLGAQAFRSRLDGGNTMYLGAMAIPADIMDASSISAGPPLPCLSQSRLTVSRRMLTLASSILTSMETTGAELLGEAFVPPDPILATPTPEVPPDATPQEVPVPPEEQPPPPPPSGSPSDAPFMRPSTASFIASAFSAARSSGIPSTMTISRRSRNSEPVTLSLDMDSQGNITHVSSDNESPPASFLPRASSTPDTPPSEPSSAAGPAHPQRTPATPPALATVLDELNRVNQRLQQFYVRYHDLLRQDPTLTPEAGRTARTLASRVSEVLHCLSHAYHAISDIMCDFSAPPPRQLRCRPVLIQHSAVLQAGIPINAQISMMSNRGTQSVPQPTAPTDEGEPAAPTAPTAPDAPVTPASPATSAPTQAPSAAPPPSAANAGQPQPRIRILRGHPNIRGPPTFGHMAPGNLELIMEVGPGSITIDSVEATLLAGNTAVPLGTLDGAALGEGMTFSPWGSPSPPEFIQNLMQAVAGHMINRSMESATSSAATTPTTAAPTTTTGTGEAAGNAAGQNSQARGNTATHPTTSTQTRSTSRPHVHLAQSVPAFDPFLPCNSHHCSRMGRHRATQSSSAAPPAADEREVDPGQVTPPDEASLGEQDPLINLIEGFIEGYTAENTRPEPTTSSTPASATPEASVLFNSEGSSSATEGNSPAFPVALISEIMEIVQQGFMGNTSRTTVVDVLNMLPYHFYSEGEFLFTDLIMVFARNLSFQDIFALQLGQGESLDHLQAPLCEFVTRRVLQSEPPTTGSVAQGVQRMTQEIRPYLDSLLGTRLRAEIDVIQTVNNFIEVRLAEIISSIARNDNSGSFGRWLTGMLSMFVRELYTILRHCCLEEATGVENILRSYVSRLTDGIPQALRTWTTTSSLTHLRTFTAGASVPIEEVQHFLVLRAAPTSEPASVLVPEVILERNIIQVADEPMETDPPIMEAQAAEVLAGEPDLTPLGPIPEWRNTLPSDWVPIIAHDSQRQRRQNSQAPFSDAYLSGLPSKRRKVVSSTKPQGSLNQVIAEGVRHAAEVTGAAPNTASVEIVAETTGTDANIQAAYRDQVRAVVRDSLANNPDFAPEKFPNTAKYFTKK